MFRLLLWWQNRLSILARAAADVSQVGMILWGQQLPSLDPNEKIE
jgi:hypothetical protein